MSTSSVRQWSWRASVERPVALLLLLLIWLSSCTNDDPTQLIVVVNSDYQPTAELDRIVIRVSGAVEQTIGIRASSEADAGFARVSGIPLSFGVVPPGADAKKEVTIEVEGWSPSNELLARVRAQVGFVHGERRVLTLALTRVCHRALLECSAVQTCVAGACVPYDVAVENLPTAKPGDELNGVVPLAPSCGDDCSLTLDAALDSTFVGSGELDSDGAQDAAVPELVLLPEPPPRPLCNAASGTWSDVGRELARAADGTLCPILTPGYEWGTVANTLEQNLTAVRAYVDRAVEVNVDVIGVTVAQSERKLKAVGFYLEPTTPAAIMPDLREVLALPALQQGDQPLQLVLLEDGADPDQIAEELLDVILDTGVTRACRPIYLVANGPVSFDGLRRLRTGLRSRPEWAALWPLVHFSRRVLSESAAMEASEIMQAKEAGFDRLAFSTYRLDLPFMMFTAAPTDVTVFDTYDLAMVHSFCGAASGVEKLIKIDRPSFLLMLDETRTNMLTSRQLVELDVSSQREPISYRGHPDLTASRPLALGDGTTELPALVDERYSDYPAGRSLHFEADRKQRLVLHNAKFDDQLPDMGFFSVPVVSIAATVRLADRPLAVGERQVIVSKKSGMSGWALELINESGSPEIRMLWYGRGLDDQVVREGKVSLPLSGLPELTDFLAPIFAESTGGALILVVGNRSQSAVVAKSAIQHLIVTNDVPITVGADPDGQDGFFDGYIQRVRVTGNY